MDFSKLQDFLNHLTAYRMPGNAIVVYKDGKEVFRGASGFADRETGEAMTARHAVNIYSCSKVATVTAALQLYERGHFLLDTPVYEFLPEYRELFVKDESGDIRKAQNVMTMRHLFTMTSGLDYSAERKGMERAREITKERMDTVTVAKCLAEDPLQFEPGERWMYGLSHDVLAAIVEVISEKRFSEYLRENIFEPLDMKTARFHAEKDNFHGMAQMYRFDDIKGEAVPVGRANTMIYGPEYESGGAGIVVSVEDYAKFANALSVGGKGILSPGTIRLLQTNQLSDAQWKDFSWAQMTGYGYGLGVRTCIDTAMSGTTGSLGEFGWGGAAGATFLCDPKEHFAYFYAHHMLNPQEEYYQPRLRNVAFACLD